MVVVGEVEAVLQLGLGVLGICVKTHGGVHDLGVVFAGFLALHQLLQTRKAAERVYDNLSGVGIGPEEQLALGDVTGVVRDGVGDVAVVEGGNCDDGDGTVRRKLHGFLVDLCKVTVKGTRHGVLGRNLVHTVGHN